MLRLTLDISSVIHGPPTVRPTPGRPAWPGL